MEFRGIFVLGLLGVAVCYVQGFPNPRDSTVVKTPDVTRADDGSLAAEIKDKTILVEHLQTTELSESPKNTIPIAMEENTILTPRHISCQHEEATEDLVCQEHCLPKGYSYGLCVGYKCSCI